MLISAPRYQTKRTPKVQTASGIHALDHVCIPAKQPAAPTGQLLTELTYSSVKPLVTSSELYLESICLKIETVRLCRKFSVQMFKIQFTIYRQTDRQAGGAFTYGSGLYWANRAVWQWIVLG